MYESPLRAEPVAEPSDNLITVRVSNQLVHVNARVAGTL